MQMNSLHGDIYEINKKNIRIWLALRLVITRRNAVCFSLFRESSRRTRMEKTMQNL